MSAACNILQVVKGSTELVHDKCFSEVEIAIRIDLLVSKWDLYLQVFFLFFFFFLLEKTGESER